MPIPLELGVTLRSDNPLCCVGCCSSGDLDINVGRGANSGNTQENQDNSGDANFKTVSEFVSDAASNASDNKKDSVITTQPKGSPSISSLTKIESTIEKQVDELAIDILRSERSGRCCTVIYDSCSPRCTAPCGNPICGCSKGECGFGSFGRLLCGIFDACCVVGTEESRLKLSAWHRSLRQKYDPVVVGIAEKQTGILLQNLLIQGRAPTTKEKEQIEAACAKAHSFLTSVLGNENTNSWKMDQDNCISLLEDKSWLKAIDETLVCEAPNMLYSLENVLIVSKDKMPMSSCEPFSMKNLGKELSSMKVSTGLDVYGILGVSEATIVAQIVSEVIYHHPENRGNFWLTKQELRYLVCLVLGIRNLSFIDAEGEKSHIASHRQIRAIRNKCRENRHSLMLSCSTSACIDFQDSEDNACLESSLLKRDLKDVLSFRVVDQLFKKHQEAKDRLRDKKKDVKQEELSKILSYNNDAFIKD